MGAGNGFFLLVIQFIPALIETLNIAGAATLVGGGLPSFWHFWAPATWA
jgi:hypothetical protein